MKVHLSRSAVPAACMENAEDEGWILGRDDIAMRVRDGLVKVNASPASIPLGSLLGANLHLLGKPVEFCEGCLGAVGLGCASPPSTRGEEGL